MPLAYCVRPQTGRENNSQRAKTPRHRGQTSCERGVGSRVRSRGPRAAYAVRFLLGVPFARGKSMGSLALIIMWGAYFVKGEDIYSRGFEVLAGRSALLEDTLSYLVITCQYVFWGYYTL
jgi:hypothetical protein